MNTLTTPDNLNNYFASIGNIPILTNEEEIELANRIYYNNDLAAARKMIMAHLKFVVFIAKKYVNYGLPMEDLVQEGNVGLMQAIQKFNPENGVKLITFAVWYIRANINEYVIKNWKILKSCTTHPQKKLFYNLRKLKITNGHSTEAERAEIAKTLKVSIDDVRKMEERLYAIDTSYNFAGENVDDVMTAPENNLYDSTNVPEVIVEKEDYQRKVMNIVDSLPKRDRDIVLSRNFAEPVVTLNELSHRYNISKERVRQLEKRTIDKLKEAVKNL